MSNEMWHPEDELDNRKYRLREPRGPFGNNTWRAIAFASLIIIVILVVFVTFLTIKVFTLSSGSGGIQAVAPKATVPPLVPKVTPTPLSPTPVPTFLAPTPTTPSITVNSILCQADASHGWSSWKGTQDWHVLNGMLLNDGTGGQGGPTILAPCDLPTSDYAVEATIQVVHWPHCCYSQFAITVRGTSDAYSVGEDLNDSRAVISSQGNFGGVLVAAPFDPGTTFSTYRVEVKGNRIKLLINGGVLLDTTDNSHLSGTQVGLWSYEVQLTIRDFKVIAL